MKHKINHLSFGNKKDIQDISSRYGISMNTELDGSKVMTDAFRGGQLYVEYILDITEAEYEDRTSATDADGKHMT